MAAQSRSGLRDNAARHIASIKDEGLTVAICPKTGVAIAFKIAGLPASQPYEMDAPFASIKEAKKLLAHSSLSKCSNEILAGLLLALAGPSGYKLLDLQDMTALEANAALREAEHDQLCSVLRTLDKLKPTDFASLPKLAMPECALSVKHCLKELQTRMMSLLPQSAYQEIAHAAAEQGLTVIKRHDVSTRSALALARASQPALAKYEVPWHKSSTLAELEAEFRATRKQAKEYWLAIQQDLMGLRPALISTMKALLVGTALADCHDELRAKLVTAITKIPHAKAQPLARLIKDAKSPYIKHKPADIELEDLGLDKPQAKRSLAEIIAAKKAGAGINSSNAHHNPNQADSNQAPSNPTSATCLEDF